MTDNAFSIDSAPSQDSVDTARRKKISALGLQGLSRYANEPDSESLSEKPLYGGNLSKASTVSAEADEPSQLSTERVQRAPASQEANPLLPPNERLGNLITGEEGSYGPLTGEQRKVSLKDFFNSANDQAANENQGGGEESSQGGASQGAMSRSVGGAGATAATAIGAAKSANTFGTKIGKTLADLFSTGGAATSAGAMFPSGLSLNGTPTNPGEFPINPEGFNFTSPDAGNPLEQGGFNLSGTTTGGTEAASGVGPIIGAAGAGVSGALSIATLLNDLASGKLDSSKTGEIPRAAMNVGMSALPVLESLVPGLTGISGLGLAATPLLIPAIMSIIDMFKEPNFPEVNGQKTLGLSDYKSAARGAALAPDIASYIQQNADNPAALFGLVQNRNLNPEGEAVYTGTSLSDLLANPSDQGVLDFIRNAGFSTGATGHPTANAQLTDTYQRTLAHALGITPEQAANLFGPDQAGTVYDRLFNQIASNNQVGNIGPGNVPGWQDTIRAASADGYSDFGGYSPYYRDPAAGHLDPTQVQSLLDLLGTGNPAAYYASGNNSNELLQQDPATLDPYLQSLRMFAQANQSGDGGGAGGGGL